jgi:hypothetical protein
MAHFAQINETNIVAQVIVADQEVINTGLFGDPASWIQTSYNTYGGMHKLGGTPLRKNFAGIGYTYDRERDAFIPPKPYNSWVMNEDTCLWNPPIPYPADGKRSSTDEGKAYKWNESIVGWEELIFTTPE